MNYTINNFRKYGLILLALICLNGLSAQEDTNDFWDNVRFGGGIGVSFGDGFFSGTLAPSAIYDVNEKLSLGVGLNGTYNSLKNTYNSTIIGASVLGLYNVIREIQLSAEFEELNVTRNFESGLNIKNQNYWYPALFVGAGYRTRNVTVGVRYDVLYDEGKSVYANAWAPFFRVYF